MIIRRFSGLEGKNGWPYLCEDGQAAGIAFRRRPGGDGSDHPWFSDAGGGSPKWTVDRGDWVRLWVRPGRPAVADLDQDALLVERCMTERGSLGRPRQNPHPACVLDLSALHGQGAGSPGPDPGSFLRVFAR